MPSKSKNAKAKKKSTGLSSGSVEAAIKVMTLAMEDPLGDHVCAIRLGEASLRIDGELASFKTTLDKSKFARSHPELLRAGIRFLTTKHKIGPEYMSFVENMSQCTHKCTIPQSVPSLIPSGIEHDRCTLDSEPETVWLYHGAINTISTLIELSLLDLTRHKFHTSHTAAAGVDEPGSGDQLGGSSGNGQKVSGAATNKKQKWPSGPDDLLPFGIEDSAYGLALRGYSPPLAAGVYRLVGALASFYAPFSQYVIGPAEPDPLFNTLPIRFIQHVIEDYDMISSKTSRRPVPLDSVAHHFAYIMSAVFGFYASMQRCESVFPHVIAFYTGPKFAPYFDKIIEILNNPAMARSMKDVEQAKTIVKRIRMYSTSDAFGQSQRLANMTMVGVDTNYNLKNIMDILAEGNGVDRVFDTLQGTRKAGCLNVECPLPEASAVHAMLCSKCDLVRFCSRDCLKSAWNSQNYPHKRVCSKIHALKAAIGADTWSNIWSASTSSDGLDSSEKKFEQACKSKGIVINDVESMITRHLRDVQKRIYLKYAIKKIRSPEHRHNLIQGPHTERNLEQMQKQMELIDSLHHQFWNTLWPY